jgi:hypothetical protein
MSSDESTTAAEVVVVPSYAIVIIRRDETLDWLDVWGVDASYNPSIYLYNKNADSSNTGVSDETVARLGGSLNIINVQNVVDDTSCYIYHILSNPSAVSAVDYTVFMHANPFEKITIATSAATFKTDLETILSQSPAAAEPLMTGLYSEVWDNILPGMNIKQHYYDLFSSPDAPVENATCDFADGCQWIVPKSVIEGRSTNYYKFLGNAVLNGKDIKLEDLWQAVPYEYEVIDIWCIGRLFAYVWNLSYVVNPAAEEAGAEIVDAELLNALLVG